MSIQTIPVSAIGKVEHVVSPPQISGDRLPVIEVLAEIAAA